MATLDEMVVRISAETAGLRGEIAKATNMMAREMAKSAKEVEKVNATLDRMGGKIKGAIAGALGGLSVAKLVSMTRETLEWADGIKTVADRLGTSTDAVQELIYAGREVNITAQQMTAGMEKFAVSFAEAASGKGRGVTALKALFTDAEIAQIKLKGLDEQWIAFSEKLKQFNRPSQIAITKAFFGEDAVKFLDLLGDGAEKLKRRLEEARQSGTIISPEQIARGEQMNKQIERITDQVKSELRQAFIDLGPVLVGILSQLAAVARAVRLVIDEARNFSPETVVKRPVPEWVKRWSREAGLIPPAKVGELARGFNPDLRTDAQKFRDADRASMQGVTVKPAGPGTRNWDGSGTGASQAEAFRRLMEDLRTKTEQARAALDPYRAAIADLDGKLRKMTATDKQAAQAREEFNRAWNALGAKALTEFGAESDHLAKIVAAEAAGRRDLVAVLEMEWALRQKFGEKFVKDNAAQIEALAKRRLAIEQLRERQRALQQDLESLFDSFAGHAGQALDSILDKSKTVGEAMRDFFIAALRDIANEMFKLAAINPLKNILFGQNNPTLGDAGGLLGSLLGLGGTGGFSGGDIIGGAGGFSIPFMAEGGRISGPAIVGERGPELFVPDTAGMIVPNRALGGGSVTFYGSDSDKIEIGQLRSGLRALNIEVRQINRTFDDRAVNATVDARRRGGYAAG